MNFSFEEDSVESIQSTLDIPSSKNQKSKSLDNINSVNNNLNSYPSNQRFNRGDVEYVGVTIGIPSNDYDFIYGRFEKCLGNTQSLLLDFYEETILDEINLMRGDDNLYRDKISLPRETMRKINGMMYYHQTKGEKYVPMSLDEFIIQMVDELYEIRRDSYEERGKTLYQILGGVDNG